MKQGHQITEQELRILSQYLDILTKIIILEPNLSSVLETNGLRQPANNPLEVKVVVKPRELTNQIISEYLLETFIELSRIHSPPLETLGSILEALKNIYIFESQNTKLNPLTNSFKKVALERHGFGSLNSPDPLFVSLSKLRIFEKSSENYSVTFSMLEFCIAIFQDDSCMRIFPMSSISLLSEALKYCLSEVLPECLNMSDLYKWRNSHLLLNFMNILLIRYSQFLAQSFQPCGYIDLISNQLNKTNLSGFLETVLQVVTSQSEFNEITFLNIF